MLIINEIEFTDEVIKICDDALDADRRGIALFNSNIKITPNTYFSDDSWDFSNKNLEDRKKYFYMYDYYEIDIKYKFYIKKVVLNQFVIEKNKPGTVSGDYSHIKAFILYLQKRNVYDYNMINSSIIKDFFGIEKRKLTERTKLYYKVSLKLFFKELEYYNKELDCSQIFEILEDTNISKKNAEIEANKTPQIPDKMFDKMMSLAIKDINNPTVSKKDKLIASCIIMFGEVGMRIEEFQKLEVNKINSLQIDNSKAVYYLEFKTFKTIRNKSVESKWTETYLSDKAKLAYDTMVSISKDIRAVNESNYIYNCSDRNSPSSKLFSQTMIRAHIRRFIITHYDSFNFDQMPQDDIICLSIQELSDKNLYILGNDLKHWNGKSVYYVHPHQFRVTVCTRLYNNNVPLEFIKKHMNHLDEDMTQHYIRENALGLKKQQAMQIVKEVIDKTGNLLETDVNKIENLNIKNEMLNPNFRKDYEDINRFLEKNHFKIKENLDEVIDLLTKSNTPLTEFAEGFCAHNALANICKRQEYISSINDMYFGGVNIPCVEYLSITYERFKEKVKLVRHNEKIAKNNPIYLVEYKRELKALKRFTCERLLPELNLAKEESDKVGLDKFIVLHKELEYIMKDIENIYDKEILEWII